MQNRCLTGTPETPCIVSQVNVKFIKHRIFNDTNTIYFAFKTMSEQEYLHAKMGVTLN